MKISENQIAPAGTYEITNDLLGTRRCALGHLANFAMGDAPAAKLEDSYLRACHTSVAAKYFAVRTLFARFVGLSADTSEAIRNWAAGATPALTAEKLTSFFTTLKAAA